MPITHFNVTEIAHDDQRMLNQLLHETGRTLILDPQWLTLDPSPNDFYSITYTSKIEFILLKTNYEVQFQRITPTSTKTHSADVKWSPRNDSQYYILKVDPLQKIIVAGNPLVRFFRSPTQPAQASTSSTEIWTPEKPVRPWEAEDVNKKRNMLTGEYNLAEDLAEASRRFKAWRANATNSLFVYLMVPNRLSESEWSQLIQHGFEIREDVPWIL